MSTQRRTRKPNTSEQIRTDDVQPLEIGPIFPIRFRKASGLYKGTRNIIIRQPRFTDVTTTTDIDIPDTTELNEDIDLLLQDENGVDTITGSVAGTESGDYIFPWRETEELRLDIDGRYPQNTVSGTIRRGIVGRVNWIARLRRIGRNVWGGNIWYKDGMTTILPQTNVIVKVRNGMFPNQKRVTTVFSGGGHAKRIRRYSYVSPYFHKVEFEYDRVEGIIPVTSINTDAHPNHPASLPTETLTISNVYRRAGFDVSMGDESVVTAALADSNGLSGWSDQEMHDAMQTYWSRFTNAPMWAMWVFFADQHERGSSLGGIMFDDIGPNHRQGTALFYDSFISNRPSSDPAPDAFVDRMRFWTAIHEMGHAFNLAHSWQKNHPPSWGSSWIPLANDAEARSFMNYPYNVAGGQNAFFSDFNYRFLDEEMLFLRHSPGRFVQMGRADWFDNHGFQNIETTDVPLTLEARVHRKTPVFEFMEPVYVELKLTNTSNRMQVVNEDLVENANHMTIITRREGQTAKQVVPFVRHLHTDTQVSLAPGESMYGSILVSVGTNGWNVDEPGRYLIQVAINQGDMDIVSQPLNIIVGQTTDTQQLILAQDFFTEDVGRVVTLGGSRVLTTANTTIHNIVEQLPHTAVSIHARQAMANVVARDYKLLNLKEDMLTQMRPASEIGGAINVQKAQIVEAEILMADILDNKNDQAIDTLGHIGFKTLMDRHCDDLVASNKTPAAAQVQDTLLTTLKNRGVIKTVLADVKNRRDGYRKVKKGQA